MSKYSADRKSFLYKPAFWPYVLAKKKSFLAKEGYEK